MAWRDFDDNANTYDSPVPVAVVEKANDERYAADFNMLVQVYALEMRGERQREQDGKVLRLSERAEFVRTLRTLASRINDGWGASDALVTQAAFDDYGPAMVLRALARAYDEVTK